MRKYDALRLIFENDGIAPKEMEKRLGTAIPNIYTYLKELQEEHLIKKDLKGKYHINKSNEKPVKILSLQAMAPTTFHQLITPSFRNILEKLCKDTTMSREFFTVSDVKIIEGIAIPSRIVLKLNRKPAKYCLKINEMLVSELLKYHGLHTGFDLLDFQNLIEKTIVKNLPEKTAVTLSDSEVRKICDKAYADGADVELLKKAEGFEPDKKISELLKNSDLTNKEYQLYINGLQEDLRKEINNQWKIKYVYNTNSIEGNTMTEEDVKKYLKGEEEEVYSTKQAFSEREVHETNNMRHALDYLGLKKEEDVSEELMKEIHFILLKDIRDDAGKYKTKYNCVDNNPTTPPQHIKERMNQLIEWYKQNKGKLHPLVFASIFHMQFEWIHPFGDGNGRVGRLLLNLILEKNKYLPLTILAKTKQNYYQAIENKNVNQFTSYALISFLNEYRR